MKGGGRVGWGHSLNNPHDESRANEEIQALNRLLDQLIELNKRFARLEEVHDPRKPQDETSERPTDSQPPTANLPNGIAKHD